MTLNTITSWDHFMFKGTMDDVAQMQAPLLRFHDRQESESLQQEVRLDFGGRSDGRLARAARSTTRTNSSAASPTIPLRSSATRSAVIRPSPRSIRCCSATPFPLPVAAPGQLGFLASNLDTEYVGVYGQSTWNLSDQLPHHRRRALAGREQGSEYPSVGEQSCAQHHFAALVAGGGERQRPRARHERSDLVGDAAVARHG